MSKPVTLLFLGFLLRTEEEQGSYRAYVMEMEKQNIFVIGVSQDADGLTQEDCPWQYGMLTRVDSLQWQENSQCYVPMGEAKLMAGSYETGMEILFKKASYPPTRSGQDRGFVRVREIQNLSVLKQIGGDDRPMKVDLCQPEIQEFLQKDPSCNNAELYSLLKYEAKKKLILFVERRKDAHGEDRWDVLNLFSSDGGVRALLRMI